MRGITEAHTHTTTLYGQRDREKEVMAGGGGGGYENTRRIQGFALSRITHTKKITKCEKGSRPDEPRI